MACSSSNRNCGQRARQFGLADAGRSQEDEAADGTVGVLQSRARAQHRLGDRLHRLVLADHPLVQFLFQVQQLLQLAFQQLGDRDMGPAAHHFGDVLLVDLFLEQADLPLLAGEVRFGFLQLPLEAGELAVLQLGGLVEVVLPLGQLDFVASLLDLARAASAAPERNPSRPATAPSGIGVRLQVGQFLLQLRPAAPWRPHRSPS